MLESIIEGLKLPKLLEFTDGSPVTSPNQWQRRREEILALLCEEEYGIRPEEPSKVSVSVKEINTDMYGGKLIQEQLMLTIEMEDRSFSFPLKLFRPKGIEKPMVIIYISFTSDVPNLFLPLEEITDEGFAVVTFNYNDVAVDGDDDFTGGLAGILKKQDKRPDNDTGKIMMWAWAASRVMDYLHMRDDIDHDNIAIAGHSRLGKTALVAAAYDERFNFVFANNSGCSGDAITRGKKGERIKQITDGFPYWFCPNYKKYAMKEEEMPFDQHFLVAAIAPRFICSGTAAEDTWCDPYSQYLCYVAADEVYKLLGEKGFIHPDRLPQVGDVFQEGTIGFHMRAGTHFLSRYDWRCYMEFMKKNRICR